MREVALISSLHLHAVVYLILVVELHFPAVVVHVHRAVLVIILRGTFLAVVHGGVLIEVVVVSFPLVGVYGEVYEMLVREVVAVVQFSVEHPHVVLAARSSEHHPRVRPVAHGSVAVRYVASVLSAAEHHHSVERDVVLVCGVPRDAGACEQVVAHVLARTPVTLVLARVGEHLVALRASVVGAVTVADVGVCVEFGAVIVYIEARVCSSARASARLQRAVIARLAVLLEHNVYYTSRSLSRELRRRIVYHLYLLYALSRKLLQNLRPGVRRQAARLAVYPHLHAAVSSERHVAVVVHFHRRNVVEHVACRLSAV